MAELKTIITLRQGTTAEWAASEVVLKTGEMGLEYLSDGNVKIKAGDGEHLWSALPYIGSDVKSANVFQVELTANDIDDIAAIEAQVTAESAEKQDGDVAIVKAMIAEGKYSYTSYVYDSTLDTEGEDTTHGWSAMDGNYSAANVFLKDKIVLAGDYGMDSRKDKITSIGNLRIGDEIAAGTSLQALFMDMLSQRLQPADPTNPVASITLYMDGATKKSAAGAVEVGTTVTPSYTASLSAGSYTYGPATGVVASSYSVTSTGRKTVDGATADTAEDSATTATGAFTSFVVDDDTNYKLSVSIPHNAGVVANDNLGSPSNPVKQIAAGTKTKDSGAITGFRSIFYGYKAGGATLDVANLTSAQIRALGNSATTTKPTSMTTNKMQQIFFAFPATMNVGKPVVKDATNGAPQTVSDKVTVKVEGKDGFTAVDYDVYYVNNAAAAGGELKFNITY
jgi:hypothetical protein